MSKKCKHGKSRQYCRDCSPQYRCKHGRWKYDCEDCGTGLCEHGRKDHYCSICKPANCHKKYRHDATKKGLSFSINLQQFIFIISQPCVYCGGIEQRGVDRWENSIGYELENCRSCCKWCNLLKKASDGPAFVDHIRRMAAHTLAVENADDHAALEATQQF